MNWVSFIVSSPVLLPRRRPGLVPVDDDRVVLVEVRAGPVAGVAAVLEDLGLVQRGHRGGRARAPLLTLRRRADQPQHAVHGVAERRRDVLLDPQLAALGGRRPAGLLVELGRAIGVEPEAAHLAEAAADLVVLGVGQAALVVADRKRDLEQPVGQQAVVLGRRALGVAAAGRDDRRAGVERGPRVAGDGGVRRADVVEALERDHRCRGGRAEDAVDDQAAPAHGAEVPVELELEQLDVAAAGRVGRAGSVPRGGGDGPRSRSWRPWRRGATRAAPAPRAARRSPPGARAGARPPGCRRSAGAR